MNPRSRVRKPFIATKTPSPPGNRSRRRLQLRRRKREFPCLDAQTWIYDLSRPRRGHRRPEEDANRQLRRNPPIVPTLERGTESRRSPLDGEYAREAQTQATAEVQTVFGSGKPVGNKAKVEN